MVSAPAAHAENHQHARLDGVASIRRDGKRPSGQLHAQGDDVRSVAGECETDPDQTAFSFLVLLEDIRGTTLRRYPAARMQRSLAFIRRAQPSGVRTTGPLPALRPSSHLSRLLRRARLGPMRPSGTASVRGCRRSLERKTRRACAEETSRGQVRREARRTSLHQGPTAAALQPP